MCLYPKLITNKKYTANKKNGGVIPPLNDIRAKMVPVGCGKCMECKKQKAREWKVRLSEEIKVNKKGLFVTLKFTDESLKELSDGIDSITGYDLDNEICRLGIRRFLERWRKKTKRSVRHWLVNEIGGNSTERVHIHGIVFTTDRDLLVSKWSYGFSCWLELVLFLL